MRFLFPQTTFLILLWIHMGSKCKLTSQKELFCVNISTQYVLRWHQHMLDNVCLFFRLPVHHHLADYILFPLGSFSPTWLFENRIPLKPALGDVCSLANYSVAYEETQSNRVSDFRDFVCSLFPKAILFDFYFIQLYLVLCRVAAVKSLPVHHHSAGYILFPLGSLSPTWLFWKSNTA